MGALILPAGRAPIFISKVSKYLVVGGRYVTLPPQPTELFPPKQIWRIVLSFVQTSGAPAGLGPGLVQMIWVQGIKIILLSSSTFVPVFSF
jgi:hypothetical protein